MLLRRFTQHIKQQNWFAVGLDVLVVVVGIFLGLQVSEWNQQRKDSLKENVLLQRLSDDFDFLKSRTEFNLRSLKNTLTALEQIGQTVQGYRRQNGNLELDRDDFKKLLLKATSSQLTPGRAATYVELLSSGELSLISDADLRHALSEYDFEAQTARDIALSLRNEKILSVAAFQKPIQWEVADQGAGDTRVTDFDLASMATSQAFIAARQAYVGTENNNYQLQLSLLKQIDEVVGLLQQAQSKQQ